MSSTGEDITAGGAARPGDLRLWKLAAFCVVAFLVMLAPDGTRDAARGALSDAYVAVTSFVALTLILFYALENGLRLDTGALLKKHERWQVPLAALMGITPGCGGAIIVITQFALGRISFGSVVAVLTGTMGDAAFLLLAQQPKSFLFVIAVSFTAGVIGGYLVDRIHGRDYLKVKDPAGEPAAADGAGSAGAAAEASLCAPPADIKRLTYPRPVMLAWFLLLCPGIALGLGNAFQADTDRWFGSLAAFGPTTLVGVVGALFCLLLWVAMPARGFTIVNMMAHPACRGMVRPGFRVMFETSFVTSWVVMAFLVYELGTHWAAIDLAAVFAAAAPLLPLVGVLIGFIPGCGPQIVVVSLYLEGLVPFSAMLANAISNDGDALFPAIALAPRAAVIATLYTAIPALLLGYLFYFIGL